jgi:cell shape-determining protein MreC
MPYIRSHSRPEEKSRRAIMWTAVVIVALVVIIELAMPQVFPSLFGAIARPFWRTTFYAETGGFRSHASLLAENAELNRELAEIRAGYASSTIAMLESANRDLLAISGRATTTPRRYVLGAVLARPSFVPYDELVIDVGSDDGVASTSPVYSPEKILIGRINDLQASQAKVLLYSSPRQTYNVTIGAGHVSATAVGQGGGQYRASVPHGSGVQIGDFVSDNTLYDRPFGVVASVVTDPSDPFDTVVFAPPVNIYQTRFVLVDTGKAAVQPVTPDRAKPVRKQYFYAYKKRPGTQDHARCDHVCVSPPRMVVRRHSARHRRRMDISALCRDCHRRLHL